MNILIPHTWLLEHLETQATPLDIQKYLSLSGPSVERIYEKKSPLQEGEGQGEVQYVYDIEVTTNRVDSMCVRGIAREAAVILTQAGFPSQLKPLACHPERSDNEAEGSSQLSNSKHLPLPKINSQPSLSRRIMCVILELKRNPTPEWMATRLTHIDENIHDAAIDITNYITHELGHPCHAFDYDSIMELGGVINVIQATPGMQFTTLDGNTYETKGGEVIFTNDKNEIIDLPGIKGTANSAVNDKTKRILFWFESIPAALIRQASMSHNIRTVAAQLFEKNVDPTLAEDTMHRGIKLYQELCNAKIVSEIYDDFPRPNTPHTINVSSAIIENYLGISIPQEQIISILQSLDCNTSVILSETKNPESPSTNSQLATTNYLVTPPSFRPDLTIPVDIVEEIARIYGYHNLPSTLMPGVIPTIKPANTDFQLESKIKNHLASSGWQEVYTYSLVSKEKAQENTFLDETKDLDIASTHLKLANPLTDDRIYLRRSLIPSLTEVLDNNSTCDQLSAFEIANVYHPQTASFPREELHLTLVSNLPYRQLITKIHNLLHTLFITNVEISQHPGSTSTAILTSNNQQQATIYALPHNRFAVDFIFSNLIQTAQRHPTLVPRPQFPPIIQDFTLQLSPNSQVGNVISQIKSISPLISQVDFLESFTNKHSFRVYFQDPTRSLSEQEITPLREKIINLSSTPTT